MNNFENDHFDDIFDNGSGGEYEDGDFDRGEDELPGEGGFYGEDGIDGLDIPDFAEILNDMDFRGKEEALKKVLELPEVREEFEQSCRNILSLSTVYDMNDNELVPGMVRNLLTVRDRGITIGTSTCRSLATQLKMYSNDLLFGLTDEIYLHCCRRISHNGDEVTAGVRFFWDAAVSPYRLVIPDIAVITHNKALLYLLVGDLLEELVNDLETKWGK